MHDDAQAPVHGFVHPQNASRVESSCPTRWLLGLHGGACVVGICTHSPIILSTATKHADGQKCLIAPLTFLVYRAQEVNCHAGRYFRAPP